MSDPYRKPVERPRPPSQAPRWYTKSGDVEKGPFEVDAIKRSLKEGYIRSTALVRREDQTEWHPITELSRFGATSAASAPLSPTTTPARSSSTSTPARDEGTKILIYGALACTLTYIGLIFGVMGIAAARKQPRESRGKYARVGLILSVVGVVIQVLLLVFAVVIIVLTKKGAIQ